MLGDRLEAAGNTCPSWCEGMAREDNRQNLLEKERADKSRKLKSMMGDKTDNSAEEESQGS